MRKLLSNSLLSVLAGFLIGLGGYVNLICNLKLNSVIGGAIFFATGLIFICFLGLNLYTGKVGYVFENNIDYSIDVFVMAIGNFIGAALMGSIFMVTNPFTDAEISYYISQKIVTNNSSYTWFMLLLKGVLAGICVFLAVEGFKKFEHSVAKIIGVALPIAIMVIIGGEHSVANVFYFVGCARGINQTYRLFVFSSLLLSILGNILGAWFIWLLLTLGKKIAKKEEKKE